ncbi:hypothetical protein PFISCL1PPCAC_5791 [Pristionchus fissidentatus]|uniref:Inhibitor of growth protein n=1 Tax=Pristionchus fissidentatus TaxID=1538716 RepID=A0AAV5V4W8_9BILA|nr:hypothetical protein PFISCL1PPCAC_5791 [Pristionchus fissidentatus]
MLFLDDFLEMLEELPEELRERCKEIKELDAEITAASAIAAVAIKEYFEKCETMKDEDRLKKLRELQAEYARLRGRSEEKVALAERMQELLEKYTQHLEKEKTHLKYELEADNAGVTEVIEKRFADYVDQMFSMRKERRKRVHSTTSNGVNAVTVNNQEPSSSSSRSMCVSIPPPSKLARLDSSGSEGASPSPALPSVSRARKQSMPVTNEEAAIKEARRETIRQQLHASLHLKTQQNGGSPLNGGNKGWSSPSSRSRQSPSTPNSNSNQFIFSPSALSSSPSTPQTSVLSPALSSMPNFISTESRHGRPRKLTSRVQEMFNSNQCLAGHRERSRHSSSLAPSTPSSHAVTTPMGNVTPPAETNDPIPHPPRSRDMDGDEEGSDERPWCFCNEKSYGGMVACDNKECPYEWFHWPCVGLDAAPRGKWFCPHCEERLITA